jgi:di/tricarboxylate transporter
MLGALIPFGRAMTNSGAASYIGNILESLALTSAPWILVGIMLLFTMLLTNLINNATTAIIMAPIAIGLAQSTGSNQDLYLMTVALGACSTFLTPIGHPANMLIKVPGKYRFSDYWKLGLVIQLINLVAGTFLLIHYWG